MKLTIDAKVLAAAAAEAAKALPRNPSAPILNCLLLSRGSLGHLHLAAFDYDTSVSVALPDVVDVDEELKVAIPGRALATFAGRLKGDVTLEVADGKATLTSKRTTITLHTLDPSDYPTLPEPLPPVLTVDGAQLAAAVADVLPAVSTDQTVPALMGVHLQAAGDRIFLTSTDRYAIARREVYAPEWLDPSTETRTTLLSGRMLADVVKTLTGPVQVGLDDSGASLTTPDRVVTLRAIAGDFPQLGRFLTPPEPSCTVTVDKADLLDALDLARAAVDEPYAPVILDIVGGTDPHLDYRRGDDQQQLLGALDAAVDGVGLRIGMRCDLLGNAVKAVDGDTVTLAFTTARKPVYIACDDGLHVVMPIALPSD